MRTFTVYLVATRRVTVTAATVMGAEAVALAEATLRWPDCNWQVSDTEENA